MFLPILAVKDSFKNIFFFAGAPKDAANFGGGQNIEPVGYPAFWRGGLRSRLCPIMSHIITLDYPGAAYNAAHDPSHFILAENP